MNSPTVALLANQGPIGGGEVMLLHIAEAVRGSGRCALVVAPAAQPDTLMRARREGFETRGIPGSGRAAYLAGLRRWARREGRSMRLWCNGLLPVVATGGLQHRIAHLHQVPAPRLRALAALGVRGVDCLLVPSEFVAHTVEGAQVFPNWTDDFGGSAARMRSRSAVSPRDALRIGILGRLTRDKGICDLLSACEALLPDMPVELVIGGETRFGGRSERALIDDLLSRSPVPTTRLGWVRPSEYFAAVDVVAVPSRCSEAFGLVASEAMSAGARLVVSDDGALPEVVGHDYPLIHRAGDAADLADCLRRAAALTQGEAERLISQSRRRWESLHSPAAGAVRVGALLTELEENR